MRGSESGGKLTHVFGGRRPDEVAFSRLLVASLPGLRRYAAALAGSVAGGDDLVQATLERAWRNRHALEDTARIGAWLRTIVLNAFRDERRRRPWSEQPVDELENELPALPPSRREEVLDVVRAMEHLTDEHRRVLILAGVEELSYAEIADELGVPIGTVMSRLARARAALRARLAPAPEPVP